MIIKDGFDNKPLHITIIATKGERTSEIWIKQEGLLENDRPSETLSYITIDELLNLQDEVRQAIKTAVS